MQNPLQCVQDRQLDSGGYPYQHKLASFLEMYPKIRIIRLKQQLRHNRYFGYWCNSQIRDKPYHNLIVPLNRQTVPGDPDR
jgi:hypothetical protein